MSHLEGIYPEAKLALCHSQRLVRCFLGNADNAHGTAVVKWQQVLRKTVTQEHSDAGGRQARAGTAGTAGSSLGEGLREEPEACWKGYTC